MKANLSHLESGANFDEAYKEILEKIKGSGDNSRATVQERIQILEDLATFELGRFLIVNRGMNGYWTHAVCTYPIKKSKNISELERFLLAERPMALATQERFQIFLKLIQGQLQSDVKFASIPSGLMGDLLLLNYSGFSNFELTAIDIDEESLLHAEQLAISKGLHKNLKTQKSNAWSLDIENYFDLISSSGLNIYVHDDEKVIELYRQFHRALKPGGVLVTSFFSKPPWRISAIDSNALNKQIIIYGDILEFKASALRTAEETRSQLEAAGFESIKFYDDRAGIFPTVHAVRGAN